MFSVQLIQPLWLYQTSIDPGLYYRRTVPVALTCFFFFLLTQKELIMDTPRKRIQTKRFGNDEAVMDISELETSSDSDGEGGMTSKNLCLLEVLLFLVLFP
jgi:hypothetical protein